MKVGDCFKDERKCHIVAILEKEDEPQVVYKYYGKYKQWWHYKVESLWVIEERLKLGLYKVVK